MNFICKLVTVLFLCCAATLVRAEEITNFSSVFEITQDGKVLVTETILYDFDTEQRHGIFRTLKTNHPQAASAWYKRRFIDITISSVQQDGLPVIYDVIKTDDELEIKIGDPNRTISGAHTYIISYVLSGALSYGEQGAEFYYNVVGTEWPVPIETVRATVLDATGALFSGVSDCYVGEEESVKRCIKGAMSSTSTAFTVLQLPPYEGLTIALGLNKDRITLLSNERVALNWLLYICGVVWIFGLSVWVYRFKTQFKTDAPVIAQYEPYSGVLPMYTGVVFDGKLDPHDITAGIVYLAEQEYIKIRKTEEKVLWIFTTTDYELVLLKSATDELVPALQETLSYLFSRSNNVGVTARLSSFVKRTEDNRMFLKKLQNLTTESLKSDGFVFSDASISGKLSFTIIAVLTGGCILSVLLHSIFIPLLLGMSVLLITYARHKRRTAKGYGARNYLKGFKLFLSITEKERYTFFNAPEKSPELFMKYLPYAIAFKVEKEWAEVFEGITLPNPSWYEGGSVSAFSAAAFTSDMGAFSSSFSSSSASGTSGSSGGGFSGGGGGGGGGGSW